MPVGGDAGIHAYVRCTKICFTSDGTDGGECQLENGRMYDFTPQGTSLIFPEIEISFIISWPNAPNRLQDWIKKIDARSLFCNSRAGKPFRKFVSFNFVPRWSRELSLL